MKKAKKETKVEVEVAGETGAVGPIKFYESSAIPKQNVVKKDEMTSEELQTFITSQPWYQVIDFGNGVRNKATHNSEDEIDMVIPRDMEGLRYLDIGIAQGYYVLSAAMRGATAFGIDNKIKQIKQATRIASHFGIKTSYTLCDIMDAPTKFPEYKEGFDVISMMSMFHHLRKPKEALRIVRGMCKGYLMAEFCCWIDGEERWEKTDEFPEDWGAKYHKAYPTLDCVVKELESLFSKVEVIGPLKAKHRFLIKATV